MFLPFICLSAVNIGFGGFWRSRALLAVSWLGGLFYGGMSLLCRCLRALCVGFVVFRLLSVILSLSGGRRLCVCCVRRFLCFVQFLTAVCVFTFLCFCRCFFCANFSSLLMSVFIFFSVVECCLLAICVFTFPHYKSDFLSAWRFVLRNMSFFAVDYAFFVFFLTFFCTL